MFSRRCLLVEDDATIAEMYQIALEQAGWDVEVAPDGVVGLTRARAAHPTVVLLDIMLPRLDGFGVLEGLHSDPEAASIPVVVLSNSYGEGSPLERARQLGARDWLTKSNTSPRELVRYLDRHFPPPKG